MQIVLSNATASGKLVRIQPKKGVTAARAYVYFMTNASKKTFAFVEDVFVDETYRGQGLARKLYAKIATLARGHGCYKIVACSRMERDGVHAMMAKLGYKKHGYEFRMDL